MTQASMQVVVYRSSRRAETYLYLPVHDAYEDLPEALRQQFGEATEVLTFELDAQRQLAQADPEAVLSALSNQGFYLQMPPPMDHSGA